jgi:hypothetical protein
VKPTHPAQPPHHHPHVDVTVTRPERRPRVLFQTPTTHVTHTAPHKDIHVKFSR